MGSNFTAIVETRSFRGSVAALTRLRAPGALTGPGIFDR